MTDVRFVVTCFSLNHIDANQSVVLSHSGGGTVPDDGAVVSVTSATLAPLTTAWPTDGEGCAGQKQEGGALSRVTLRAPTTAGMQTFTIVWDRALQPAGSNDGGAISRLTAVDLMLRVVANTAAGAERARIVHVEGDRSGGWIAAWAVAATDAEDDPDRHPPARRPSAASCRSERRVSTCSVTDAAGASDSDGFDVTVVDTTPPVLAAMPADLSVTTPTPQAPWSRSSTRPPPTSSTPTRAWPATACQRLGLPGRDDARDLYRDRRERERERRLVPRDRRPDRTHTRTTARPPAGWSRSPGRRAHSSRTAAGRSRQGATSRRRRELRRRAMPG